MNSNNVEYGHKALNDTGIHVSNVDQPDNLDESPGTKQIQSELQTVESNETVDVSEVYDDSIEVKVKQTFELWKHPENWDQQDKDQINDVQELSLFSMFLILNEKSADQTLEFKEIEEHYISPGHRPSKCLCWKSNSKNSTIYSEKKLFEKLSINSDDLKSEFNKYAEYQTMDFREFQKFMENLKSKSEFQDFDNLWYELDDYLLKNYLNSNWYTKCFKCGCCFKYLKKYRMDYQIKDKYIEFLEVEQNGQPLLKKELTWGQVFGILMDVYSSFSSLRDLAIDSLFVYIVYYASVDAMGTDSEMDYFIVLTISFLSLIGPLFGLQSCIISLYQARGDFEPLKLQETGFLTKLLTTLQLSFIGGAITLAFEFINSISRMLKILAIFSFRPMVVKKIDDCFVAIKFKLFNLNKFQQESLEAQKQTYTLMFENMPQAVTELLIFLNVFRCRQLVEDNFVGLLIAFISSCFSVIQTFTMAYFSAKSVDESSLTYLMSKMSANCNWIPFIHKITKVERDEQGNEKRYEKNINFSQLSVPFQFSDETLIKLLKQLLIMRKEEQKAPIQKKNEELKPEQQIDDIEENNNNDQKKHLIVEAGLQNIKDENDKKLNRIILTQQCLQLVSLNALVYFIQKFPYEMYNLQLYINWNKLYKLKVKYDLVKFKTDDNNQYESIYSPMNEPLLHLCIKDNNSKKRYLRQPMKIILKKDKFSPFDTNSGCPIKVAIVNNDFEALRLLLEHGHFPEFTKKDEKGISIYSMIFTKIQDTQKTMRTLNNIINNKESKELNNQQEQLNQNEKDQQLKKDKQELQELDDQCKILEQSFRNKIKQNLKKNHIEFNMSDQQFYNKDQTRDPLSAWQVIFKSIRQSMMIENTTKILLDQMPKERQTINLKEYEKSTLFKSSTKLILQGNISKDKKEDFNDSLNMLSHICNTGKLDIFNFKDNHDKTFVSRFVSKIPQEKRKLEGIFSNIQIFKFEDHENNLQAKQMIVEMIVEQQLIFDLFKADHIEMIVNILEVDSEVSAKLNTQQKSQSSDQLIIRDLNEPELESLILFQLAKTQKQDLMFKKLMEQIKLRLNIDTYKSIETKIAKIHENQAFRDKRKKKQDQKQTKKDVQQNHYEEQDNCPEELIQQQKYALPEVKTKEEEGINEDKSIDYEKYINIKPFIDKQNKNRSASMKHTDKGKKTFNGSTFIRKSIEIILEWIAFGDLVTDYIVIQQLIQTEHKAWTVITIFSMLAPIYASQTSLLMFFKDRAYKANEGLNRIKILTLGYIMITPLMIVYMLLMDVIFIFTEAFLYPIIQFIRLLTCFKFDFRSVLRFSDCLYKFFFDMEKQDVEGFRRMRIISQLTFETVIQCFLQARMLQYFRINNDENVNVDDLADDLLVSLCFSFGHLLLEVFMIIMEAKATKTNPLNYAFVCFNGKFGWVPYNDFLQKKQQEWFLNPSSKLISDNQYEQVYLDYENISHDLFGLTLKLKFKFDDYTLETLQKTLDTFPKQQRQDQQPVIHFGATINQIKHESFEQLLQVTDGKFKIDLAGTNLQNIFKESPYERIFQSKSEESNNSKETEPNIQSKKHRKSNLFCCCSNNQDKSQKDNAEQGKQIRQDQKLNPKEKTYLQGLITSKKYQLLDLILQQSGHGILGKPFTNYLNFGEFLVKTIIENQDLRLLQIVLAQNSDSILEYMNQTKVVTGGQNETNWNKLVDLMDYNIWSILATSSSVFNTQACRDIVLAVFGNENSKKIAAKMAIFWNARFGPSFPKEIIQGIKQYKEIDQFFEKKEKQYPKKFYVRKDNEYVEIECKTAFKFAKIREYLVEAWNFTDDGPSPDLTDFSPGYEKNPMDIDCLGTELKDLKLREFKIVNMLLSETQHMNAIHLVTKDNIDKLDNIVSQLNLDIHKMYYIGRSRQFFENRKQIEVELHGKTITAQSKDKNQGIQKFKILEMFDQNINKNPLRDSLVFKLPKNMKFVTKYEIEFHTENELRTHITSTNKCKYFNQSACLMYKEKNTDDYEQQIKSFDSIQTTQVSKDNNDQQIPSSKDNLKAKQINVVPMIQLENMHPGAEIRINCFPSDGNSFIKDLKLKLTIDFGLNKNINFDRERSQLETTAEKLYQEYLKTKDTEINLDKKNQIQDKVADKDQKLKKEEPRASDGNIEFNYLENQKQSPDTNIDVNKEDHKQIGEFNQNLEANRNDLNQDEKDFKNDDQIQDQGKEVEQEPQLQQDYDKDLNEDSQDDEQYKLMFEELEMMQEIADAEKEEENEKLKYQQEIQNLNKMVDQAELLKEMHVANDEQRPGQDQHHLDRIVKELQSEYQQLFVEFDLGIYKLKEELQKETEQLGKNQQDVEEKLNQSQKINEKVNLAFLKQIESIKSKLQDKVNPYLQGQYTNQSEEQFQLDLKIASSSDVKSYQEIRKHNKTKLQQAINDMEKDQKKFIETLEIRVNQELKKEYSKFDEVQVGLAEIMVLKIDEELQKVARTWRKRPRTGDESHNEVIDNYYEELKQNITNYCEESWNAEYQIKYELKKQLDDKLKPLKKEQKDEVNQVKKDEADNLKQQLIGKNKAEAQEITKKLNQQRDQKVKEIQKKYNKLEQIEKQEINSVLFPALQDSQRNKIEQYGFDSKSLQKKRNQFVQQINQIKQNDLELFQKMMNEALPAILKKNEQLMRQQTIDLLNLTLGIKIGVEADPNKPNQAEQFIEEQRDKFDREIEEIKNFSIADAEDQKEWMLQEIEGLKDKFETKKQLVKESTVEIAQLNYQEQIVRIQKEKLEEDKIKLRRIKEEASTNLMYQTMQGALKEQEKLILMEEEKLRLEAEKLD